MFTMQEVAAIKVAIKRNSRKHLEDWIAKWESKNGNDMLEQFENGIEKEVSIQIYYHENDNYDELWKVVGTPDGESGSYYIHRTYGGGVWYTVCDPLGYCEANYMVKDNVLFIICDCDGRELGASSNVNPYIPTLKETAKAEWNRVKDGLEHFTEDTTKNFWSMCWDGTSTLGINQWLETYMDTDLYEEEIKSMHGYLENWVMRCEEISKTAVSTFTHLGVGYAIYKVKYRHTICGVEYYEYYSGRYPFMGKYESYVDFYASWFDADNVGTMYPKKVAIQKVKEQLKEIYGETPIGQYKERYGGKLIYPYTLSQAAEYLIDRDYHRVSVDKAADNEKENPCFEKITPDLFDKYGDDLEIVCKSSLWGSDTYCSGLRFDENGKLLNYI